MKESAISDSLRIARSKTSRNRLRPTPHRELVNAARTGGRRPPGQTNTLNVARKRRLNAVSSSLSGLPGASRASASSGRGSVQKAGAMKQVFGFCRNGQSSIHHRRLENAHHRRVRRLPAEIADPMRHVATVAQCLAGVRRRCRLADLDLEFTVQDRQALDRTAQMGGRTRELPPDRPENRTIAANPRFSANRSLQDGTIRRRRRRSVWSLGPDAR